MARSHNDRTTAEIRAQKCIEKEPALFAKQVRGEAFTVEESEQIAICALPTQAEIQATHTAGVVMLAIFLPIIIGVLVFGAYQIWKSDKELREENRRWEEARHAHFAELERKLEEAREQKRKLEEAREQKRGKK